MLKKMLKIGVISFGVILLLVILLPIVFKSKIVSIIKDKANEQVEAKLDFGRFDLSLLRSFPNFTFSIYDFNIIGINDFDGDTLVHLDRLDLKLNLMGVIKGDYTIKTFEIDGLVANAIVLENGKLNWDIVSSTDEEESEVMETTTDEVFHFELTHYAIKNATIRYFDYEANSFATVNQLNHVGKFVLQGEVMDIITLTDINEITYKDAGISLTNKAKIHADATLQMENDLFTFKDNRFTINALNLGLDGWVNVPDEGDITMDLKINALDNQFKDVLSLVPTEFKADFAELKTDGEFDLNMWVKGVMNEDLIPTFNLDLKIKNAYLQYPDLPEAIKNIQMDLNVHNPDGISEHTVVDLSLLHLEILENPIHFKFLLKYPDTDPYMKGEIKSKLNLANLAKVIPMDEGELMEGSVNLDLIFEGRQSYIDQEQYDRFNFEGMFSLLDFTYQTPNLPQTLISTMYLNFTPQQVKLSSFEAQVGKSDFAAEGTLDNLLAYVLLDETLKGNFSLNANYLDLNEWMDEEENEEENEEVVLDQQNKEEADEGLFILPKNIDFTLRTDLKKIIFDDLSITNFKGKLSIQEGNLVFHDNRFELLESEIGLKGAYYSSNPEQVWVDFGLTIKDLDIPTAFKHFNTVKNLAPVAQYAQGKFSLNVDFNTLLTDSMTPVFESLNGKGWITTKQMVLNNHPLFTTMAGKLSSKNMERFAMDDLRLVFKIVEGKVHVEPTKLKMGNTEGLLMGWNSFDQTMDYLFELKIPRSELGSGAEKLTNELQKLVGKTGTHLTVADHLLVDVEAKGDVKKPTVTVLPRGTDAVKDIKTDLKNQAEAEVKEVKAQAEQVVEAKKEELKAEVDEAKLKAEQEIERQKQVAQEQLEAERKKIEEEKKRQEEEAKQKARDALKNRLR